ncbi:uncharacterized protein ATNIH1004_010738 [Aspergillus tanneri]|uniref:Uncharacterized protein n=1 Tax=Aspergillus tanneri TaxID=1220188 RepID=A0A5M9MB99_9EURO|nr:uncharacterized protein ATNIH1004_010738 [Aspergillus tanneri]KAA8641799.1 hypothetical protein ATNIH1004_010738 [Aspergillus tanneri]
MLEFQSVSQALRFSRHDYGLFTWNMPPSVAAESLHDIVYDVFSGCHECQRYTSRKAGTVGKAGNATRRSVRGHQKEIVDGEESVHTMISPALV